MWSAAHDDDAEFRRRYAGSVVRIRFMLEFHAQEASAKDALKRLRALS